MISEEKYKEMAECLFRHLAGIDGSGMAAASDSLKRDYEICCQAVYKIKDDGFNPAVFQGELSIEHQIWLEKGTCYVLKRLFWNDPAKVNQIEHDKHMRIAALKARLI